ncbi:DNA replication terminus site-binding protein [Vibrio anguillarum]|uniref:DNA replication terminus site-binding protein n=1 Tax=Vibrio anguillarum TaxID=55601 RepID=UPI001F1AE814|nr:DNA replication terminus site-binding protein [Vibrio anguillarum]
MMSQIKMLFDDVTLNLSRLNKLLTSTTPSIAIVSRIPPVHKGNEHEVIKLIMPEHHSGMAAMKLAGEGYLDLHIKHPYSQKSSRRYVGVIHLLSSNPNSSEIVQLIHSINQSKADIEELVITENETRQARFKAVHDNCPGVMTKHLYRQIHCLVDADVKSVKFSWQRKDALHQPNKAKLLTEMSEELVRASPENELPLTQLIKKVASTPDIALRIRRGVKVQPAANVTNISGLKTVTAPLPIIVVQKEPFYTEYISSFVAAIERKPRSDKQSSEILGTFHGRQIERKN